MTDHAEISRRLALAIGWDDGDMMPVPRALRRMKPGVVWILADDKVWRVFDYRDPLVIWPIAERYRCFPYKVGGSAWGASTRDGGYFGDTAAEAVALAVIAGARVPRVEP